MKQITKQTNTEYTNAPVIETSIKKSRDGKWIVHKTIITSFKPTSYMNKVIGE